MGEDKIVKQVIVVRKDLNMRKGKIGAQCAHASMKVLMDYAIKPKGPDHLKSWIIMAENGSPLELWLNGIFTKICVYCESEVELLKYYTLAKLNGIMCAMVTDSGATEFHNHPTNTCIAIGPDFADKIDEITGHLNLL